MTDALTWGQVKSLVDDGSLKDIEVYSPILLLYWAKRNLAEGEDFWQAEVKGKKQWFYSYTSLQMYSKKKEKEELNMKVARLHMKIIKDLNEIKNLIGEY